MLSVITYLKISFTPFRVCAFANLHPKSDDIRSLYSLGGDEMELILNPALSAIFCATAFAWVGSFAICLLSLSMVSKNVFSHWMPEIKAISFLMTCSMLTIHQVSGRWWFF